MNLTKVNEAAVNSARMVSQVVDEIEQQRALEIKEKNNNFKGNSI